ncbi:MAG TPA: MarR family transcriptional regulator [Ilumatobacter sp.]|nr:MarR family transcriptional regulator [Ilumatobacter sp.]
METEGQEALFRAAWRDLQRGRSIRRVEAYARENHPELDLRQTDVLGIIVERGGCRLTDLSAQLGLDVSNASRTVTRLVNNGHVSREDSTEDGRAVVLTATKAGERVWNEVNDRRTSVVRHVLSDMSPTQRANAVQLLERMVRSLDEFADQLD